MENFKKRMLEMSVKAEKMPSFEKLSTAYDTLLKRSKDTLAAAQAISEDFNDDITKINIPDEKLTNLFEANRDVQGDSGFILSANTAVNEMDVLIRHSNYLYSDIFDRDTGIIGLLKKTIP